MTARRLILVRHAQTDANLRLTLDSKPPGPPLTDVGLRQAADLADALAGEPVAGVYASTAVRAQQTARPVAARHGLAVRVVDGLHEVFMGELEGTEDAASLQAFIAVAKGWSVGELDGAVPGGESGRAAIDRFTAALTGIAARHADDAVVVVVTHAAVLRVGVPSLAPNVLAVPDLSLVPNTGRVILDTDAAAPAGWRCVRWVDTPVG